MDGSVPCFSSVGSSRIALGSARSPNLVSKADSLAFRQTGALPRRYPSKTKTALSLAGIRKMMRANVSVLAQSCRLGMLVRVGPNRDHI